MPPLLPFNMANPLARAAIQVETSMIKEAINEVMNHKMKDVVKELTNEIRVAQAASNPNDAKEIADLRRLLGSCRLVITCMADLSKFVSTDTDEFDNAQIRLESLEALVGGVFDDSDDANQGVFREYSSQMQWVRSERRLFYEANTAQMATIAELNEDLAAQKETVRRLNLELDRR